jgi:DNA-binding transcriptional ArsR family regulator
MRRFEKIGTFTLRREQRWFKYYRTMATYELEHPAIEDVSLADVLFALSDPARLEIVREVADGPLDMAACGATNPDLPKSTKSHLMKVLREAGIVRNVPNGRGRLVSLRKDELDARFPGLLDSVLRS